MNDGTFIDFGSSFPEPPTDFFEILGRGTGIFFSSPLWQGIEAFLFILAIFLAVFCFVLYVKTERLKSIFNSFYLESFKKVTKVPENPFQKRWEQIARLFASSQPSDQRLAIIEADAMLDDFIISLGYPGNHLGERLKNMSPRDFPALQHAWEGHKVRNRIAHEGLNFHLSQRELDAVRKHYEAVFHDAGIIS